MRGLQAERNQRNQREDALRREVAQPRAGRSDGEASAVNSQMTRVDAAEAGAAEAEADGAQMMHAAGTEARADASIGDVAGGGAGAPELALDQQMHECCAFHRSGQLRS